MAIMKCDPNLKIPHVVYMKSSTKFHDSVPFPFLCCKILLGFFFFLASGAISPHSQTCVYRFPPTYEPDLWTKYSWLLIVDVYEAWLFLRF